MYIFVACMTRNKMKNKSTLEEQFEELGNDHVSSSEDTPLRKDAFVLSDDEKIERIRENIREVMLTLININMAKCWLRRT